jgi:hypothetical protein
MDEQIIRGLVLGLMLFMLFMGVAALRKLWASPSEGARRLRVVFKGIGVLALIGVALASNANDRPILIGIAVVIGVVVWVVKGFRK